MSPSPITSVSVRIKGSSSPRHSTWARVDLRSLPPDGRTTFTSPPARSQSEPDPRHSDRLQRRSSTRLQVPLPAYPLLKLGHQAGFRVRSLGPGTVARPPIPRPP